MNAWEMGDKKVLGLVSDVPSNDSGLGAEFIEGKIVEKMVERILRFFIVTNIEAIVDLDVIQDKCRISSNVEFDRVVQALRDDEMKRFVVLDYNSLSDSEKSRVITSSSQNVNNTVSTSESPVASAPIDENKLYIKLTEESYDKYREEMNQAINWSLNVANFLRNEKNKIRFVELSTIGQMFPRPSAMVTGLKLIELLECDPESRFEIIKKDSKVFCKLKYRKENTWHIDEWKDAIVMFLRDLPENRATVEVIEQYVIRPKNIPKSYNLAQLLCESKEKFSVNSSPEVESSHWVVELNLIDMNQERLLTEWRNAIIAYFVDNQIQQLDLSTLGSLILRPRDLCKEIRISSVLSRDPLGRFFIREKNGITIAFFRNVGGAQQLSFSPPNNNIGNNVGNYGMLPPSMMNNNNNNRLGGGSFNMNMNMNNKQPNNNMGNSSNSNSNNVRLQNISSGNKMMMNTNNNKGVFNAQQQQQHMMQHLMYEREPLYNDYVEHLSTSSFNSTVNSSSGVNTSLSRTSSQNQMQSEVIYHHNWEGGGMNQHQMMPHHQMNNNNSSSNSSVSGGGNNPNNIMRSFSNNNISNNSFNTSNRGGGNNNIDINYELYGKKNYLSRSQQIIDPKYLGHIEVWKKDIIAFLSQRGGSVDLTFVGASVPRPYGLAVTYKLKDILMDDSRFVVDCSNASKVYVSLNYDLIPLVTKGYQQNLRNDPHTNMPAALQHLLYEANNSNNSINISDIENITQNGGGSGESAASVCASSITSGGSSNVTLASSPQLHGSAAAFKHHGQNMPRLVTESSALENEIYWHGGQQQSGINSNSSDAIQLQFRQLLRQQQIQQIQQQQGHSGRGHHQQHLQHHSNIANDMTNNNKSFAATVDEVALAIAFAGANFNSHSNKHINFDAMISNLCDSPSTLSSQHAFGAPPGLSPTASIASPPTTSTSVASASSTTSTTTTTSSASSSSMREVFVSNNNNISSNSNNAMLNNAGFLTATPISPKVQAILIQDWLPLIFRGFEPALINQFIVQMRNNGGLLMIRDLLCLQQQGQLTLPYMEDIAGMKLGHYNRLVQGLRDLIQYQ